ncbi:YoaK family protein [Hypericibacter sp.]|uniref:YoaK family protein n=1 Tax=Hypericibacter sp. TaxID=2705401 RepID=UPI003D6CE175
MEPTASASRAVPPALPAVASPRTTAGLLAFTAGFVDTCGFIALFALFTAHVTGNFVLIGAALAGHHAGIIGKLLAFPVFILAVALTHLFVIHHRRISRHTTRFVLAGQVLFLLLFLAIGVEAAPFAGGDQPLAIVTGMMGVIAMAIQNAASRTVFASLAPTTVMTGNVTQIVIDLVDIAHPHAERAEALARLRKMTLPVATFTLGALAGALGYRFAGFGCLVIPVLTTAAVLWEQAPARAAATR